MASKAVRVPILFWVIAGLSLLWNAFGALDYTMTQSANEAYLANFTAEEREYFTSFPAWFTVFWALGVWGSVAGSVLLLLRSKHAVTAFLVSVLGLLVTTIYSAMTPVPASMDSTTYWIMSAVIWAVLLLLLWYSRKALAKGYIA